MIEAIQKIILIKRKSIRLKENMHFDDWYEFHKNNLFINKKITKQQALKIYNKLLSLSK